MTDDVHRPSSPLHQGQQIERRSYIRVYVKVSQENQLTLEREDGRSILVRLVDLSIGGARIECVHTVAGVNAEEAAAFFAGVQRVTFRNCLQEPFGEQLEGMQAKVIWQREAQAGVLFEALLG